jgi:hypothetical protein
VKLEKCRTRLAEGEIFSDRREKFGEGGWEGLDGMLLGLVTGRHESAFSGHEIPLIGQVALFVAVSSYDLKSM